MKRIISVVVMLIMTLSVFGITASAEPIVSMGYYDFEKGGLYYAEYNDNEAFVVGYDLTDFNPKGEITVPASVTGNGTTYTVVGIESEAFYQSTYTKITLPSTITCIGAYAFASSDYLESVVIPENCYFTYFGSDAFIGTPFETEIYSKDETIFGQNVLYSYIGGGEYILPSNVDCIASSAFFMSAVEKVVLNDNITEIPTMAFASCRNLKEIIIPDSVLSIGFGAFRDCTNLESVSLGEELGYIGEEAFSNTKISSIRFGKNIYAFEGAFKDCKTLKSITVDSENPYYYCDGNAVYYSDYAVAYYLPCKALGNIVLDESIEMILPYAFYNCKNIGDVHADSVSYIGYGAFANSSITKFITSSRNLNAVDGNAFRNCKNLTYIDLTGTQEIWGSAFENCTSLKDVKLTDSISHIGEFAFANTGITEIELSGDYISVCEGAFKDCKMLESAYFGDGVDYVGNNVFLGCCSLKTVYLSKTISEIDDNAFNGCDNVKFEVIKGSKAYKYLKDLDFELEIVGKISIFQRIIDFFKNIFGILFGMI